MILTHGDGKAPYRILNFIMMFAFVGAFSFAAGHEDPLVGSFCGVALAWLFVILGFVMKWSGK